nr:hypothetical protein [Tanacetum cinerariifolium]
AAIINKCLTGKSLGYDSLRLSQAQILYGLYHKRNVDFSYLMWEDFVYQVEHKDTKKSNEMYYPRFTKVIIHHFMSKDPSIPRRNKMNWHYVRDDHMFTTIKNSNAYQEYYAVATGATPPKPKASVRKTRSSFGTTITPLTVVAGPRLTTSEKGKQAAKASRAKSLSALFEVAMTEMKELVLYQASDEEEFIHPSLSTHTEEEPRDEESFDPIPKTPEDTDDEGNGEENLELNFGREEGHDEEEEEDELYRHIPTSVAPLPMSTLTITPFTIATITITQQAPTLPTTALSTLIQDLPNFGLLFGFDNRLRALEANFSEFMQTNQFPRAVSAILRIVQRYMDQQMNEAVKVVVQIQSDRLRDEAQKENYKFLKTIDENMQKIIKEQGKEQVKTSYAVAADLTEMELKKIIIEKMEGNKSIQRYNEQRNLYKALTLASESAIAEEPMQTTFEMGEPSHPEFETGADDQPTVQSSQHPEWFSQQKKPPTLDHDWNQTLPATHGSIQPWISKLAKQSDSHSSFNELIDTSVDFFNFLINRLKVDTLTLKLLAGLTYDLMKRSCKSLVELEFFLEEIYKAATDQLDWVNPEGNLPLGRKRQQFYGVNRESAHDVYSKPRIIAVTELKIVEWHNYKHLDWITVRRDDDKLYKFKEGDFKRLRIQDIEDIIVIQRHVEDLQLGVEIYQKKLNLTRPDTYRSDLKRKEAYSAYSNPKGFIYQNKDKQNRLIRIDELHKFSDGTLIDVRTALDYRLKGIRMKYLPQSIWRKSDK